MENIVINFSRSSFHHTKKVYIEICAFLHLLAGFLGEKLKISASIQKSFPKENNYVNLHLFEKRILDIIVKHKSTHRCLWKYKRKNEQTNLNKWQTKKTKTMESRTLAILKSFADMASCLLPLCPNYTFFIPCNMKSKLRSGAP